MKTRLIVKILSYSSFYLAFLSTGSMSARSIRSNPISQVDQNKEITMRVNHPLELRNIKPKAQTNIVFLPIVTQWISPCGVIPFLINPPNGSHVTAETMIILDGGYRGGGYDWLGYEFSQIPDFANRRGGYLQPAGKYWELRLGNYHLEPGRWYWRASIWCNGPGWPPPPDSYEQSPYSDVWSFILE